MLDFESARRRFIEVATSLRLPDTLSTATFDGPLAALAPPESGPIERVPLNRAIGRVLASPIVAKRASPPFDMSAMDGYALCSHDAMSLPYTLPVEGEAAAGAPAGTLAAGSAMRIFTGAALPRGADAVVMQEHVRRDGSTISGDRKVILGQHIRARGEDLSDGALALDCGRRLQASSLALIGFLDYAEVEVTRAPRVSILSTGSELCPPGRALLSGGIAESNSAVIAAFAQQAGATVIRTAIVEDDKQRIRAEIEAALQLSDVLVTVGGISVGDHDYVRPVLESVGVVLELCKVALKPGKPITLGRRGRSVVIGLPGNPASAISTFALFGIPLLRALQCDLQPVPMPCWVPAVTALHRDLGRTRVVLGNLKSYVGQTGFLAHANQASGATVALGLSDGFVVLEPGQEPLDVGTTMPFYRWSDL